MTAVWVILWLVFAGVVLAIYAAVVGRLLTVRRLADAIHFARTSDGWRLALHHYRPQEQRYAEPILLCHGLGANRCNFDLLDDRSLARSLVELGFDVWSLELRGHGLSDSPRPFGRFDFDDHLDRDVPAALAAIRRLTGQPRVFWVGHSLGGMLGYALAGEAGDDALAGLIAVGAPVWLDRSPAVRRLCLTARLLGPGRTVRLRLVSRLLAPLAGRGPAFMAQPFMLPGAIEPRVLRRSLVNLVENPSRAVVEQMLGWMRQRTFTSRDGTRDYLERLAQVRIPVLLLAAERDQLAAPESVTPAYERLRSRDKQLRVFGTDAGDDFDFGHGDLLLGQLAPKVVYVEIMDWLEQRAQPLQRTEPRLEERA